MNNNNNNNNNNINKRFCSFKLIRKKTKFRLFTGYRAYYPHVLKESITLEEFNEFIKQLNTACNSKFQNKKFLAYTLFFLLICSLLFIPFLIINPSSFYLFIVWFVYTFTFSLLLYYTFKSIISMMEKEIKCIVDKYNDHILNNRNLRIDLIKKYNKRRVAIFKIYIVFPLPQEKYSIIKNKNNDDIINNNINLNINNKFNYNDILIIDDSNSNINYNTNLHNESSKLLNK